MHPEQGLEGTWEGIRQPPAGLLGTGRVSGSAGTVSLGWTSRALGGGWSSAATCQVAFSQEDPSSLWSGMSQTG